MKDQERAPRLTTMNAARMLGVNHKTLQNWRKSGKGPPCERTGVRNYTYRLKDVEDWKLTMAKHITDHRTTIERDRDRYREACERAMKQMQTIVTETLVGVRKRADTVELLYPVIDEIKKTLGAD